MVNLQRLDLNLLRTLHVLLSENNVTRAAQRSRQRGVGTLCGRPDDGRHGGAGYY